MSVKIFAIFHANGISVLYSVQSRSTHPVLGLITAILFTLNVSAFLFII